MLLAVHNEHITIGVKGSKKKTLKQSSHDVFTKQKAPKLKYKKNSKFSLFYLFFALCAT